MNARTEAIGIDDALPEIESDEVVLVGDDESARVRRAVEEVTARLEAELADARGEMGARIAELEGELEALREMGSEVEEVQAPNPALLSLLHAELSEAQTERERLAREVEALRADRERIQDELAAQIAELAGTLAAREAEVAALQRRLEGWAAPALEERVEELEAENAFLQAEIDRLAAQVQTRA